MAARLEELYVQEDCVAANLASAATLLLIALVAAKLFLKVMVEAGFLPDAVTYTSLMNGMCREGDALGALALLEEMEGKGCSPNSCTYNTLLYGLCKSRLMEKGIELYWAMKEGGVKLETAAYATLVRVLWLIFYYSNHVYSRLSSCTELKFQKMF